MLRSTNKEQLKDVTAIVESRSTVYLPNSISIELPDVKMIDMINQLRNDLVSSIETVSNEKLSKVGGTISGDLIVQGDFTVKGKVTSVDVQTVKVEDNIFLINSKQLELVDLAGIAINTGSGPAHVYGIMYDRVSDSVKIGEGRVDENGDFHFYLNEDQNLATVDWTIPDGNLAKFNREKKTFEDSGISAENIPKIWRY